MDSSSGYGLRRNTQVIGINLKCQHSQALLGRLVGHTDVMLVSSRPSVYKKLGIDYESIRRYNPRLVYCTVTGFGATGPYAEFAGHDLNYQSVGGSVGMTGRRNSMPNIPGATFADGTGGMSAAIGILAAVFAAKQRGIGQAVDVSCAETIMDLMAVSIDQYLAGSPPPRPGQTMTTGKPAYYRIFQTKDGRYLSVGAIEPWFYENLCHELGCDDLASYQHDESKQEAIAQRFAAACRTKTRDEWVAQLMPKDTCVAPVYEVEEVVRDPQFLHRNMVLEVSHPDGGTVRQVGIPYKFSVTSPKITHVAPRVGAVTARVMQQLGYSDADVERMRDCGCLI